MEGAREEAALAFGQWATWGAEVTSCGVVRLIDGADEEQELIISGATGHYRHAASRRFRADIALTL